MSICQPAWWQELSWVTWLCDACCNLTHLPRCKKGTAKKKTWGKGETEWFINLKQYKFTVELNCNVKKIAKLGRLGPLSVFSYTIKKLQDYAYV